MAEFLKTWVNQSLSSLEIRTPLIYDYNDASIKAESSQFKDRSFQTEVSDKVGIFRPGGDYGAFTLLSQKMIHESHLPISLFELVLSFRKNLTRELSGLLRSNVFNLLDHHTFSTPDQAFSELKKIILSQAKLGDFFNFDWTLSLDIHATFYKEHAKHFQELEVVLNKTITVNQLDVLPNYWTAQHYFIDKCDNVGFCDGQFDLFNAKNYCIQYTSGDGKTKLNPVICHASFGSVERWIYKLVHNALTTNGYSFPIWLSPIQVRLLINNKNKIHLLEQIKDFAWQAGIRVDIDARSKSNQDKIKLSHEEWVPFTIIIPAEFINILSPINVVYLNGEEKKLSLQALFDNIAQITNFLPTSHNNLQSIIGKPVIK